MAFYRAYQHHRFDKIYTSTLRRTKQTVAPFLKQGIPSEVHPGLDEISWGHYEGYQVSQVGATYYQRLLANWNAGYTNIPIQGGESPEDVAHRQQTVIRQLMQEDLGQVLLCMHGRAMRVLLCQLLGEPLHRMDAYPHGNLSLYHVKLKGQYAELCQADCRSHLAEMAFTNA